MNNVKPLVERKLVAGIKARTAEAVDKYLEILLQRVGSRSLLDVTQNIVRLAVPEQYKQLSITNPIQTKLLSLGLTRPRGIKQKILNPISQKKPGDISSFSDGRYSATIVRLNNGLQMDGYSINADEIMKVTRVEPKEKTITFTSLTTYEISKKESGQTETKKPVKYTLSTDSNAFRTAMTNAEFFYEREATFYEGDIVVKLDSPNTLFCIQEILDDVIKLIDLNNNTENIEVNSVEAKKLSLGYFASGKRALCFTPKKTVVLSLTGDKRSQTETNFFKSILENTDETVYQFGFEDAPRKSVQVICPTEIKAMINEVAEESELTEKKFVETLIDDFLRIMENEQEENTFFVTYSPPPHSKPHAFWISNSHYERLKEFCDDNKLKVNPLAHHLIFNHLVKIGRIKLDSRVI